MTRSRSPEGADEPVSLTFTTTLPKSVFTVAAPLPATVTQHSVFEHFGVPATDYMRMARAGAFPTKRLGRLRVASYDALLRYLTEGAKAEVRFKEAAATAPDEPGTPKPVPNPHAREEAVNWLASSRTYADYRARSDEIARRGWDLQDRYGPKLWDGEHDQTGRPNPNYDKALYEQGLDLWTASSSVSWRDLRRQLIESGELVVKQSRKARP